jgi:hypothetical protein
MYSAESKTSSLWIYVILTYPQTLNQVPAGFRGVQPKPRHVYLRRVHCRAEQHGSRAHRLPIERHRCGPLPEHILRSVDHQWTFSGSRWEPFVCHERWRSEGAVAAYALNPKP